MEFTYSSTACDVPTRGSLGDISLHCVHSRRAYACRVVIISDARRPSDIQFFQQGAAAHRWQLLTVRIEASEAVRGQRGWVYTPGVDDAESECGLDGREWDVVVDNGTDLERLDE